jgi:hypothetical protein
MTGDQGTLAKLPNKGLLTDAWVRAAHPCAAEAQGVGSPDDVDDVGCAGMLHAVPSRFVRVTSSHTGMEASRPTERAGVLGRRKGALAARAGLRPPLPHPARPGGHRARASGTRSLRRRLPAPDGCTDASVGRIAEIPRVERGTAHCYVGRAKKDDDVGS